MPDGRILRAPGLELRPLAVADAPALFAALDDDRVWAGGYGGGPAGRPRDVDAMATFISTLIDRAGQRQYALSATTDGLGGRAGALVGTSGLGDVDLVNERVHLGVDRLCTRGVVDRGEPGREARAAAARIRGLRHAPGQAADRHAQCPLAGGDRPPRRGEGRRAPAAHPTSRRDLARHRGLLDPGRRVAGGACA